MKTQIENELKTTALNLNNDNLLHYQCLKEKLEEIIENEVKGVILRSLCDEYEKNDKCSKSFFSLEKFKAK